MFYKSVPFRVSIRQGLEEEKTNRFYAYPRHDARIRTARWKIFKGDFLGT